MNKRTSPGERFTAGYRHGRELGAKGLAPTARDFYWLDEFSDGVRAGWRNAFTGSDAARQGILDDLQNRQIGIGRQRSYLARKASTAATHR